MSSCPQCGSSETRLKGDNGAKYPETRVEFWQCKQCGWKFQEVLAI